MAAKTKKASKRAKSAAGDTHVLPGPQVVVTQVNGQVTGDMEVTPEVTIYDAAIKLARANGLKSFSVKVNGDKVTAEKAKSPFPANAKSIEVYAKDTRGL